MHTIPARMVALQQSKSRQPDEDSPDAGHGCARATGEGHWRRRPRNCGIAASGRVGGITAAELEIGACQAGGVASVDDNRAITEEGSHTLDGRDVEVEEGGLERIDGDVAVLAS